MYQRILASRRGYKFSANSFEMNSDYPTLFAAPFRSADSADLMPDVPPHPILRTTRACVRTNRSKPRCCARTCLVDVLRRCSYRTVM